MNASSLSFASRRALLGMIALLFSGCLGPTAESQAPEVEFSIASENGFVPLTVEMRIDAMHPDGGPLDFEVYVCNELAGEWALMATSPGRVYSFFLNFTLFAAQTCEAVLKLASGSFVQEATYQVNAHPAHAYREHHFQGHVDGPCSLCSLRLQDQPAPGRDGCLGFNQMNASGVDCYWVEVPVNTSYSDEWNNRTRLFRLVETTGEVAFEWRTTCGPGGDRVYQHPEAGFSGVAWMPDEVRCVVVWGREAMVDGTSFVVVVEVWSSIETDQAVPPANALNADFRPA